MRQRSSTALRRRLGQTALALVAAVSLVGVGAGAASAQNTTLQGGLLGAGAGAIIGGALGGGKGAAKGAIIGGTAGALMGAAEAERRRNASPPPGYYQPGPGGQLVYDIQSSLWRLGYDPGRPDGIYGPRTANAIAAYESDHGLLVTGQPSEPLLHHMVQNGG